ncbi:MAG: hypothetical protein AAF843_18090 [Bacteroidota bacterium]
MSRLILQLVYFHWYQLRDSYPFNSIYRNIVNLNATAVKFQGNAVNVGSYCLSGQSVQLNIRTTAQPA